MQLKRPVIITSRLLPGVIVGGAFVSIEYAKRPGRDGRTRYQYHIDLPESERGERLSLSADDMQSGCQGGSLQEGLTSLLSFLSACGESLSYATRTEEPGENADLFPAVLAQWAAQNSDELGALACELEEREGLIVE